MTTRRQKKGGYGIKKPKCRTKRCRDRQKKKSRKNSKKGFSKSEKRELIAKGFLPENIKFLESLGMNMFLVNISLRTMNPQSKEYWTPAELIDNLQQESLGESDSEPAYEPVAEPVYEPVYEPAYNNDAYSSDYSSLHLSELDSLSPNNVVDGPYN